MRDDDGDSTLRPGKVRIPIQAGRGFRFEAGRVFRNEAGH